jgi:hypothetical protein
MPVGRTPEEPENHGVSIGRQPPCPVLEER